MTSNLFSSSCLVVLLLLTSACLLCEQMLLTGFSSLQGCLVSAAPIVADVSLRLRRYIFIIIPEFLLWNTTKAD